MVVYICQPYSPSSPHPPFFPYAHMSVLYICISTSALQIRSSIPFFSMGFPGGARVKNLLVNAGDIRDVGLIPVGKIP